MDDVAAVAAHHSVNRRVAARPGHIMRVRQQGSKELLPRTMKISESGVKPMECIEVVWEAPTNSR
jgi:toluene monooxygenase system protein B